MNSDRRSQLLRPYLPTVLVEWHQAHPDRDHLQVDAAMVFVDISGFTKMSERLARKGKVGAEEVSEVLGKSFEHLLTAAYDRGGRLIKFGGDALLLLFRGEHGPERACNAAFTMRRVMREIGRFQTSAGWVNLRMSVGVATGTFDFFLVGDSHRELIVTGPAATSVELLEAAAGAGQIVIGPHTAAALPARCVGSPRGPGYLLRADVPGEFVVPRRQPRPVDGLDRYVPAAIRDFLSAEPGEPEHRPVTVAFIQFEGVDEIMEASGPEVVAQALHQLVGDVQAAVDPLGLTFLGTDIYHDGGKIILVAGAPHASGNDDERMLLALRQIVARSRPLSIRVGVNHGHVFAGDIGPTARRTYTVMGDAVNLAARLMAKAAPGQILATREVLDGSRTRFQVEALPPFAVKGKTRPVEAFDVGEAVGSQEREEIETPLVGREQELAQLVATLAPARAGRGRLIEVVAEEGLGKSRLLREFVGQAGDATTFTVACQLYESSTPYAAFRRLLRPALGLSGAGDEGEEIALLRKAVRSVAPELAPWIPLIGVVLDLEIKDTDATRRLEEKFRKAQLEETVRLVLFRLLTDLSILTFEDAHLMDVASADLLRHLVNEVEDLPWLVCVTRRPVEGGFTPPEGVEPLTLELGPLDLGKAQALIDAAMEESPLARHAVEQLAQRSGGNPMFLLELLKSGQEDIPESLESLMMARIDRLPRADRNLLRRAAVLGTSFSGELAATFLADGAPQAVADLLEGLSQFIGQDDDGTYHFRHLLVRDAAYQGLPFRRRERLHAQAGDLIRARAGDDPDDQAELMSLHYFHARRFEEACEFSRIAGDQAKEIYANVDAATFYERALEAGRRIRHSLEERAELAETLGDVRERAGLYGEARTAYRTTRRILRNEPVAAARLSLKEARLEWRQGRYPQALRWITRGLGLLDGVPDPAAAAQRSQLTVRYAAIRQTQGRPHQALTWGRRAITEATEAGDRSALAQAHLILDWVNRSLGTSDGDAALNEALAIYDDLGDLSGQAVVYNQFGVRAYYAGRWDEARKQYGRAREAWLRTGDPVNAAFGSANIGEILGDQGHLEEAESMMREALPVWKAAGDQFGVAFLLSQLGRVAAKGGRLEEALRLLDDARTRFADIGAQRDVLETDAHRAEALLFRRRGAEALELIEATLAESEVRGGMAELHPLMHRIRGYALLQLGRVEAAEVALEASLAAGRTVSADYEVALTLQGMARRALAAGDPVSSALLEESWSICDRLGVTSAPAVPLDVAA